MSLINEMLRDLQQQKNGSPKKRSRLQPKMMERIPYLPLPVVLGGGAVLLLGFVWWVAGVLSDAMFAYEPAPEAVVTQAREEPPVLSEPQPPVAVLPAEDEVLTAEERLAEAPQPAALSVPEVKEAGIGEPPEKPAPPEPVKAVALSPAPKAAKATPPVVKRKAPPEPAPVKAVRKAPRKILAKPVKATIRKTQPAVAKEVPRLHPDQLPGAIRTPVSMIEEVKPLAPRPTRATANTPYGMAEEAYLDGVWALERERSGLAVRSLQHALELYPGHLQARELLVDILGKKGHTAEAMLTLDEGLEIAPDYIGFKKTYARILSEQGDYDAAIKILLSGGMPGVAEDPESHVVLATLYQRLDESFLAAQTYRNLLVAWPKTGAFWVGLGNVLEEQKLSDEAVECYKRALATKNLRQDLSLYARKRLSLLK